MKYKLVIFDLDGTLLDTLEDIHDSLNHTLRLFGLPKLTLDEVRARLGNGSARLIELSIPNGRNNPQFDSILADYSQWYHEHALIKTHPYPGVLELMEKLVSNGVKTAIVSNKPDATVKELNTLFFSNFTSAAVGEKADIRRKPAPDTIIAVMNELGVKAENTLYIGDSEVDIATAGNAGIDCISVAWGFRSEAELKSSGATLIVTDTAKLLSEI